MDLLTGELRGPGPERDGNRRAVDAEAQALGKGAPVDHRGERATIELHRDEEDSSVEAAEGLGEDDRVSHPRRQRRPPCARASTQGRTLA